MKKPLRYIVLIAMILLLLFSAVACVDKAETGEKEITIISINVNTETVPDSAIAGNVELDQIKLTIMKSDDTTEVISITEDMIAAADKYKLTRSGTHTFSVIYDGRTAKFNLTLLTAPVVQYTLTVEKGTFEGGESENDICTGKVAAGSRVTITANNRSDAGFYFTDWRIGGQVYNRENASCDITVNSDITITANFDLIKFKVTFNTNGGYNVGQLETIKIESAPVTEKDEYVFMGWQDTSTEEIIVFPYNVTKNITLNAVWESLGLVYNTDSSTESKCSIVDYIYDGDRTSLVLPYSHNNVPVTKIEKDAFKNATELKTIMISRYIDEIEDYAFSSCVNLTKIELDPFNENFDIKNGVLYKGDTLLIYPAGKLSASFDVELVSKIGTAAFYNANIASINIKSSIVDIGADAFNSRTIDDVIFSYDVPAQLPGSGERLFNDNIKTIYIVDKDCIENYKEKIAFAPYSDKIEEMIITRVDVGIYGSLLYRNITRTVDGSDVLSIEIIGADRSITSVSIPTIKIEGKDITSIGRYAFSYCNNLDTVTLPNLSKVDRILEGAFDNTKWQESPSNSYIRNGLIIMNGILFRSLTDLKRTIIPSDVTKIAEESFSGHTNLEEIVFAIDNNNNLSLNSIEANAFKGCINLSTIEIPAHVKKLGNNAFENTKLTNFSFEANSELTTIKAECFKNASELSLINLGSLVSEIENDVFTGCYSLEAINVNNDNFISKSGVLYQYNKKVIGDPDNFGQMLHTYPAGRMDVNYIIPEGVTSISISAFYFANIASVVIPTTLDTIKAGAFTVPQLLYMEFKSEITNAVSTYNLLFPVYSPEYIIVAESDNTIYSGAGSGFGAPDGIVAKWSELNTDNLNIGKTTDDKFMYLYKATGSDLFIIGADRTCTALTVPNTIEIAGLLKTVTEIGPYAFFGNILQKVSMPESLEFIGDYAFYYSSGLAEITIENITPPRTGILSFNPETIIENALIFVPSGKEEAYSAAWIINIDFVISIGSHPAITFETNGGSEPIIIDDETGEPINLDETSVIPESPTTLKKGFDFGGWFDNAEFSAGEIVFPYTKYRNIIFYAKWIVKEFTITYNTTGGSFEETPVNTVNYGSSYELSVPVKAGYDFAGWYDFSNTKYTDENGTGIGVGSAEDIANYTWGLEQNVSLNARWTAKIYTVTYDARGGKVYREEVQVTQKEVTYNLHYTLDIPEMTGYEFNGWYSENDELMANIDGTSLEQWLFTDNKTIYAKWQALTFTVTFNDGASITYPSVIVTFGQPFVFTIPEKEDSVFFGWYDGSYGTGKQYTNELGVSVVNWDKAANTVMYAQWPENISTQADFENVRIKLMGSFILTNDIILDTEWVPIGINMNSPFTGILDGNGFTISGLAIANAYEGYIGIIGYNEGIVRNINLGVKFIDEEPDYTGRAKINISYTNTLYAGSIAGYNSAEGIISNCKTAVEMNTEVTVNNKNSYTGGIAGYNAGKITGNTVICVVNSSVADGGTEYEGTLAGYHSGTGEISSCNYTRLVPNMETITKACGNEQGEDFGTYSDTVGTGTVNIWAED